MSYQAERWAWGLPVPPTSKLVLLALASHADEEGRCWPSVSRLASMTGLSERAVTKSLAALEHTGLFTRERGNGRNPSRYRLAVQGGTSFGAGVNEVQGREESCSAQGGTAFTPEVNPIPRGVNDVHPNRSRTVIEHTTEPTARGGGLVFPSGIDREAAARMLKAVGDADKQVVLDVLAAELRSGTVRKPLAFLGALIRRYLAGQFDGSAGEAERRRREAPAFRPREFSTTEVLAGHARMAGQSLDAYLTKLKMRRH